MIGFSQAVYIDKVLVWFVMQYFKKGITPFRHEVHLSKDQCSKTPEEKEQMREVPYASAVGSLMYAMLCTRLDICHAVGLVSKYQSDPGLDHWTTVKCILKYLRRTRDYMLIYGSDELIPVGYIDSDFMSIRIPGNQPLGMCLCLVVELSAGGVLNRNVPLIPPRKLNM